MPADVRRKLARECGSSASDRTATAGRLPAALRLPSWPGPAGLPSSLGWTAAALKAQHLDEQCFRGQAARV